MSLLAYEDAIDIGGGRGRLAAPAAASLARVDVAFRSAFGRAADINEAWRSPKQADENFRAYVAYRAYLAGLGPKVPWAALAYPAATSVHCRGYAVDTDDTSARQMEIWNDHGWFWTVYRNNVLVERWHLEYDASRDNHRHDPAPAGSGATISIPEDDMFTTFYATQKDGDAPEKDRVFEIFRDPRTGEIVKRHITEKSYFDAVIVAHKAAGLKVPACTMSANALHKIPNWEK